MYYLVLLKLWGCEKKTAIMNIKLFRKSYAELLGSEIEDHRN